MNRKDFLKRTCGLGAAAAMAKTVKAQTQKNTSAELAEGDQKFREGWVQALLKNLDKRIGKKTRVGFMESCGRDCARRGAIKMTEDCMGDADKLVAKLAGMLGKDNAVRRGDTVRLVYNKCYCPMVSKGPARLSDTWCDCSRGWVLEMFGTCTGKPVKVACLASIKRGDPRCEFEVKFV
ncbi:MAG TPA: DUF6144 family protein [bacterium]